MSSCDQTHSQSNDTLAWFSVLWFHHVRESSSNSIRCGKEWSTVYQRSSFDLLHDGDRARGLLIIDGRCRDSLMLVHLGRKDLRSCSGWIIERCHLSQSVWLHQTLCRVSNDPSGRTIVAGTSIDCWTSEKNHPSVSQHLRLGVFDVLPSTALDYLSPEDFRLLLNGTSTINIPTLMTYTTFNDESGKQRRCPSIGDCSALSGETIERINQFKKWFWSVLEKFTAVERQDLVGVERCSVPITGLVRVD